MKIGTIKKYIADRGFGFITPDDGGADIFFHVSTLQAAGLADPDEGDRLEFDIGEGRNGKPMAIDLRAA